MFAASIMVANLKRISCSLTELRLLFMPFFEYNNYSKLRNGELYPTVRIFKCFCIIYFLRDTFLRVKGYSISLIGSPRRVVLFPNLFYLLTSISVELLLNRGSKKQGLFESRPICR